MTQSRAEPKPVRFATWGKTTLSALLIGMSALICYRGILVADPHTTLYPWASDTLGHVIKAEYLLQQLAQGHLYPDLFPGWYVGVQMLRYYPPLPYYLLVILIVIGGNSIAAANWFIVLCATLGGLGWLPYRRWVGRLPAVAGGVLYVFLPDNVRVALAEGNLPRVLATALLPIAIYFMLRSLESDATRWHRAALSICFAAIVLAHAMMAAIYAACGTLLALLCWLWQVASIRRVILSVVSMALGVMLSGWWFLPSLTGGITELNASAMTEALAVLPLSTYLNPFLRAHDPEIIYPGAALLLTATLLLLLRRGRSGVTIALTLTGLFGVLISTDGFNALFNALPMSNLFWPLRFLGIASFALLLAVIWRVRAWQRKSAPLTLIVLGLLLADGQLSQRLVYLRPANRDVLNIAGRLRDLSGWRQATLDYSKLGSAPSYFFTAQGGREQLYGWAYQGARTARNVAAINQGMRRGYTSFVLDRLELLGADDLALLHDPDIDPALPEALEKAGFAPRYRGETTTLYHRDGAPRAYRAEWRALGIGRGAQNLAYVFPQLIIGTRTNLDEYNLDELTRYDTLFLSGFEWQNRQAAEALTKQAAQAGVHIVVDLTNIPRDPMAREPYFMGVWGETITIAPGVIQIQGDAEQRYTLQSLSVQFDMWQTYTPQGMDVDVLYHNYLGAKSAVLGYNEYAPGRVWFVGLNLPYHAALTQDPAVIDLLADLLNLPPGEPNDYQATPLSNYQPSPTGYSFAYTLDRDSVLLVPIAHHEGTRVQVDGALVGVTSFENLVAFDAPAGTHRVTTTIERPFIYLFGQAVSGLALLGILWLYWGKKRFWSPGKANDHA